MWAKKMPKAKRKKGVSMNNILFFLTPKAMCAFLYDDYTMRQALEKMESAGYVTLPILNKRGEYRGTLSEGDLLWGLKNLCYMDMRQAEAHRIMTIAHRRDYQPVRVTASMQDLVERAKNQNFVPVVDDFGSFIGIVTRSAIIKYCSDQLFPED
jgi:CBS domain-containing protein